ncbi:hypothetical protein [Methanothermococcus okinawensis]|uniref:Uncharacterized protein n=1 Tax=Methanothermococcus okinawensis (strain DSM 14208 / JCM 11175 / IH1) TaxID=647113 RepID=F8AJS8_METOI|nr:hypothetical protein [Methanothermococcus okinawensis]AEH07276.1 hypothetical protein Metok_1309 [Methanothermococcus okinawensis IH1]
MTTNIDPIVLGHNQFFGVNHLSQDAARSRVEKFSQMKNIGDVIKYSLDNNVKGMMLSTHPKAKDILSYLKNEGLADEINFYPMLPYAQGYVRKANEKGVMGLFNEIFGSVSTSKKLKILFKGGMGVLQQDIGKLLSTLIDIELIPFNDLNVKAVFFHNVFADLALAMDAEEIFGTYIDHVKDEYDAIPSFGTFNFARMVMKFDEWGFKKPLIMASFNKVGFQMNPSKEECERVLNEYDVDVMAMSTLAAGYLKPKEAYEYLGTLPNIKSVVVGVSTKEHADETFGLIRKYCL